MSKQIKYIPVLKWKAAEVTALSNVETGHRETMIPLAEIVLPGVNAYSDAKNKVRKPEVQIHSEMVERLKTKRVNEIPSEFVSSWGNGKMYYDVTLLHDKENTIELKRFVIKTIAEECAKKSFVVIPVINIVDSSEIFEEVRKLVVRKIVNEVCIRVTAPSLRDVNSLNTKLAQAMKDLEVQRDRTHLLIDLKYIESSTKYDELFDSAQTIEKIEGFKEFILAGGSFPVDMSEFRSDDNANISRYDWNNWKRKVAEKKCKRVPLYADYSIRHPYYNDSLQFMESTSTLKYTLEDTWMIMKGKKRAFGYYLANASVLVTLPEFVTATNGKKEKFSFGDGYIVDKAKHFKAYAKDPSIKGTGRNQDWIAAGISHHTALVMHQLSTLAE